MSQFRITVLLFSLFSLIVIPQLYAQHAPGTRWKQRETQNFILIYPETMSEEVAELAAELDGILGEVHNKKWPIVLTNLGVEANGFVTLAPRHSVWYAVPGEEITAVSDWWMLLARHEGKHMSQFDTADQGTTRFLHTLFGEMGWGAGIVMGTPPWLLEGDAVIQETILSEEGRGRDPLFTMQFMALVNENPDTDYYHGVNQSFKNHIPDYYRVGYEITSWIREEYGEQALEEIYRSSARIPIPVIGLNTGTKRATGKKPRELYRELAQSLSCSATALQEEIEWTPAEILSPPPQSFTRYDALFSHPDGSLYARKETLSEAPSLVRILPGQPVQENENTLIRLPRGGRVSMAALENSTLRVAWNSIHRHPVYLGSSVSDITVVDINDRVIRRRTIIKDSRYLYPALSPDGLKLAAVEFLDDGSAALVILEVESGKELRRRDFHGSIPETAAYPSWSPDGTKLVFSLRDRSGRWIAEWGIAGNKVVNLSEKSFFTVKNPVYSSDGKQVFYSSNESGLEAVWTLPDHQLAAQRWYGAYMPIAARSPAGSKAVYIVEYSSSLGERISRVNLPRTAEIDTTAASSTPGGNLSPSSEETNFPETDYKPAEHALNIHSWGLSYPTIGGSELHLGISSKDILGTLSFKTGALYEITERSPGAYAQLAFTAMRPIIGINGEYRYRSPEKDPFHQSSITISALYPANLARTGIWNHKLDVGIAGGLISYFPVDSGAGTHYPILSYLAQWSRLRPGSKRAFRPDLGWKLSTRYSQIPMPGNYNDSASAELKLYFPGGFRNTSLSFNTGIEKRSANFTPLIRSPRGYDWDNPELAMLGSIDYEFPLIYPDLPMGSVIFIQRLRMGLFSDFGNNRRWSTGAALTMDFSAFNNFPGLSIGLQFSWRWLDNTPRVDFMIMELPVF